MATGDDDALYARAFHGQLGPVPVEVRQCNENTKGQGVFARRAIEKNEVIFIERPFAVAPDLFWTAEVRNAPEIRFCSACMASHVPNPFGDRLPFADTRWPKFFPVSCCDDAGASSRNAAAAGEGGDDDDDGPCWTHYCNKFCRANDLKQGHARMCGKRREYNSLVEYLDKELPEAWDPMRQAVLLVVRLLAHMLHERQQTGSAAEHQARQVHDGLVGGGTNRVEFWQPDELYRLVAALLGMSEEEKAFFTAEDLSTLIGKAFCNTISIRPRSAFSQYMSNSQSERRRQEGSLGELLQLAESLQHEGPPEQDDEGWEHEGREGGGDESDQVMFKASELDGFFARLTGCSAASLYSLHSKMNHSCTPNAVVVSGSFIDSAIEVVALADIRRGEEVCFSYTDPRLSKVQRRRKLQINHFFLCVCKACLGDNDEAPPSAR